MNFIQVGDIKLQYDEAIVDIDRIEKIIKLNQYLFTEYSGKTISLGNPILAESDNIIYISDFDSFFDNLLKTLLENNSVISSLQDPDLLSTLYIHLLIKQAIQNGNTNIMLDNNISDDIVWFMIASKFFDYKTEFNELSNFLKYRQNTEPIIDCLKNTQRFKVYNYLLEITSNYLKEYDTSFFDNIDEAISQITQEIAKSFSMTQEADYALPKMSHEKFDELFFNFFDSIQAPERWKKIYIELKKENRILFTECLNGLDNSAVFLDTDSIVKIRVTDDKTIGIFVSLVHEFMHYISLHDSLISGNPPFSLKELPTIYFEKMAAKYLISIGYNENVIKQVIKDRNQNNIDIYFSLRDLIIDICRYNKKGPITREDKIAFIQREMEIIYDTKKKLTMIFEQVGASNEDIAFLRTEPNYNYGELVDKDCDDKISTFIKEGLLILNGYQYLIDSYLVNCILDKNDDNTIDKMIFITDHLADFNIEKIINYFGIDNTHSPESRSLK